MAENPVGPIDVHSGNGFRHRTDRTAHQRSLSITYQDIPVEPWRKELFELGLPVHLVNHLATIADLHRAGRYDRTSDDVLTLTGQGPLRVREVVRKNAATFTSGIFTASN